ncbi:MAG: DUF3164 family protein [Balneola sp.]|nr:DUF3164 family protein [Balneola sp.]
MAIKNKKNEWISGTGKAVKPVDIKPMVRERDRVVESIFREIELMQQFMQHKKEDILSRIDEYKQICEEEYNASFSDTGAITLTNYSANKQIEIKINNLVKYNEVALLAEFTLKSCIRRWSEGASDELIKIVDYAFELDAQGALSRSKLASLRSIEIDDENWHNGLDMLKEAEYAAGSRQYIMVRERKNPDEKFQSKSLNFSTV